MYLVPAVYESAYSGLADGGEAVVEGEDEGGLSVCHQVVGHGQHVQVEELLHQVPVALATTLLQPPSNRPVHRSRVPATNTVTV